MIDDAVTLYDRGAADLLVDRSAAGVLDVEVESGDSTGSAYGDVKMMYKHKYDTVFFYFNKTLNMPALHTSKLDVFRIKTGSLIYDSDIKMYVYNYECLGSCSADIITDIKSNVPVKLKYNDNLSDVDEDFKLYNFLSPYCRKSFNFYFDPVLFMHPSHGEATEPKKVELNFSMRCYILNDTVKKTLYKKNSIHTKSHIYSNGVMFEI